MTIDELLAWATLQLPGSDTPQLDARVLLGFVLGKTSAALYARSDDVVADDYRSRFEALVLSRKNGVPVAYLTGAREFWSLELMVNRSVLIPRPDTELAVERVLSHACSIEQGRVLDLGTGSGAIALAIASELPTFEIIATDVSAPALALAAVNQTAFGLKNVSFVEGNWYNPLRSMTASEGQPGRFDIIVSNPPYIDPQDPHLNLGDVRFEPSGALVAQKKGYADLKVIIEGANDFLFAGGWLILEHGYDQGDSVRALLEHAGFDNIQTHTDLSANDRVSEGQKPDLLSRLAGQIT